MSGGDKHTGDGKSSKTDDTCNKGSDIQGLLFHIVLF